MKIYIDISISIALLSFANSKVNIKTHPYTDVKPLENLNFLEESGVFIQELGNMAFSEGCYHLVMTIDYQHIWFMILITINGHYYHHHLT